MNKNLLVGNGILIDNSIPTNDVNTSTNIEGIYIFDIGLEVKVNSDGEIVNRDEMITQFENECAGIQKAIDGDGLYW
ncbi:MAG: hypothetical protein WA364_15055 [Candidatus Nitrosopolaris sp.]